MAPTDSSKSSFSRSFLICGIGALVIASTSACSTTESASRSTPAPIASAVTDNKVTTEELGTCGLDGRGKEFFGRWIAAEGGKGSLPAPGGETWSSSRSTYIDRDTALNDVVSVLKKQASGETSNAVLSWAEAGGDPANIPPKMQICLEENGWTIAELQ